MYLFLSPNGAGPPMTYVYLVVFDSEAHAEPVRIIIASIIPRDLYPFHARGDVHSSFRNIILYDHCRTKIVRFFWSARFPFLERLKTSRSTFETYSGEL